jgi:PAS domain S-box-containing protein
MVPFQKAHSEQEARGQELTEALTKANAQLKGEAEARNSANAALRESEHQFRELLDHISSGVAIYEPKDNGGDFVIKDVNQPCERISKLKRHEVVGRGVLEIFPGLKEAGLLEILQRVCRTGEPERHPLSLYRDNRLSCWAETYVYKLPSGDIVTIYDDVTRRKEAEEVLREREGYLRCLLSNLQEDILVIDPGYRVTDVNHALLAISGVTRQEAIGRHCYQVSHGYNEPCHKLGKECMLYEVFEAGEPRTCRHEFVHADGSKHWIDILLSPLSDETGAITHVIEAIRDITEQIEALRRRTEELSRSNADLEQFAYVASHDLQEPLRMVSSYVQLLAKRYGGRLDADADAFIAFALDGANRMQTLIRDLLAYSRVGTKGKNFEPIDCKTVFNRALSDLQLAIQESQATVTHDPLPTVVADETQLEEVFQNLIGNAIKFRETEPPRVHVSAKERKREWLFSFQDNGIGIDPKYRERVFAIFQRLHGRGKYAGTGIGLAICKKIVNRHGGRIWVESQPGHGSIFYFTLPKRGCGQP